MESALNPTEGAPQSPLDEVAHARAVVLAEALEVVYGRDLSEVELRQLGKVVGDRSKRIGMMYAAWRSAEATDWGWLRRDRSLSRTELRGRPKLYFWHIPKCAGTTFGSALASCFESDRCLEVNWLGKYLSTPLNRLMAADFLWGHLGKLPLTTFPADPLVTVTVLREPVERLASVYAYSRKRIASGEEIPPGRNNPMDLDFPSWVTATTTLDRYANSQARWLASDLEYTFAPVGEDAWQRPSAEDRHARLVDGETSVGLLAAASAVLESISVVGCVDYLRGALVAVGDIGSRHGWWERASELGHMNASGGNELVAQLSKDQRRAVEETNQIDIALYRRVMDAGGVLVNGLNTYSKESDR